MKRIAIIGTGIMGSGIAANFLKHGYPVTVWNRNQERLAPLVVLGATAAATPGRAAAGADLVFEATANDESSRAVWLGEDGILAGAAKEAALIANGTISVAWADELANLATSQGFTFFDMPMTGGRIGAEIGKLVFLAGGDEAKLQEILPDLAAVSEKTIYFGKAGFGIRYKLLLNMLQAIHIAGLGEVLRIAEQAGMDVKRVGDALAERPGGTTTNLAWRDYQKPPEPINFSVQWIEKDLRYAREFAATLEAPLLDQVLSQYHAAIDKGLGEDDWTVINRT